MSTVKTTNLQHPSSAAANITLGSDGSVVLPAGFTGGLGTNVVQAVKTDSFSTTSSTPVLVTGLEVDFTPTSASSKVLLLVSISGSASTTARDTKVSLWRDATEIAEGDDGAATTLRVTSSTYTQQSGIVYLDSPATTSQINYEVRVNISGDTAYINRRGTSNSFNDICTITAIEVAA